MNDDSFDKKEISLPKFKDDGITLPKIQNTNGLPPLGQKPLRRRQPLKTRKDTVYNTIEKESKDTSTKEKIGQLTETIELPKLIENSSLPKIIETAVLPKLLETISLPKFKEIENHTINIETVSIEIPDAVKEEKPKKESRANKYIMRFALGLSVVGIFYSGINIITWHLDNVSLEKEMAEIQDLIQDAVIEIPLTPVEDLPDDSPIASNEPTVDYSRLSLLDVDFTKLKEVNPETQAFLKINNLDISIPVVQTTDNSFYLSHSFDRKKNSAGWIFGDYRNDWDNLKTNTIIYGHNRTTNVLFGSLKLMYNKSWYENKDNHIIYLATENKSMLFEIFSVYDIPTETYYLANEFGSEEVYQEYLDTITARSLIPFESKPTTDDKLLTLSTCRTSTTKTVVHARLIKMEEK